MIARHVRIAAAGLGAALLAAGAASTVGAGADKVDVCHWSEGNGYIAISVSSKSAANHLDTHEEDLVVGGSVTADCEQATVVFARAFSTNSAGEEVLISQIEDTNGDGVLSPGDFLRTGQYPLDFEATAFGTFGIPGHTIASIIEASPDSVVVEAAPAQGAPSGNRFQFLNRGFEIYSELGASGGRLGFIDDGPAGFPPDQIFAEQAAPSFPLTVVPRPTRLITNFLDDAYLDIEISLPTP